uniref:MAM domain-containing protein n=1 Tax=Candidatus Kentrum sp. DK TaxID=2126562 RepID=A0A450TMS3_9GAMM|nr:MAG: hypothetical protein BECKDK2373C_GA0170839_12033 [Candidatus Kentron sp. DK]
MKNLFSGKVFRIFISALLVVCGFFLAGKGFTASHAEHVLPLALSFQDFEENNGTPGNENIESYCRGTWFAECRFEKKKTRTARNGNRSLQMAAKKYKDKEKIKNQEDKTGGTVRISPSSAVLDLSNKTLISLWIYDTQGYNTVELKLCNDDTCSKGVWSSDQSSKDGWQKITWLLSRFQDIDKREITGIEVYEWNPGTYYIDDIQYR